MTSLPFSAAFVLFSRTLMQMRRECGRHAMAALLLVLAFGGQTSIAQTNDPSQALARQAILDHERERLSELQQASLTEQSEADLLEDRNDARATVNALNSFINTQQAVLDQRQAVLKELGAAAPEGPEAQELTTQRSTLSSQVSDIETQLRMASLLIVEADQLLEKISAERRSRFHAELTKRAPSVLSAAFWNELRMNQNIDARKAQSASESIMSHIRAVPIWLWFAILAYAALVLYLYREARRMLQALTATRIPSGGLRRCLYAWAQIVLAVIVPLLLLGGLNLGITWRSPLSPQADALLIESIVFICFGGYIASLGSSLLAAHRPSWRLPPLPDETAWSLRYIPVGAAVLVILNGLADRYGAQFSLSLISSILINLVIAALTAALIGLFLWRVRRLQRAGKPSLASRSDSWLARQLNRWMGVLQAVATVALLFSVGCLLAGYVALGAFILKQMIWSAVIVVTAYLLSVTVSDAAAAALKSPGGQPESSTTGGTREQLIILGSGIGQVVVFLFAAVLLLAPYGHGPTDFLDQLGRLRGGLMIGELNIKPMTLLQAIALFALGILAVKTLKHWLQQRLLPATGLDRGIQASASTLIGYAGYVIALVFALASTGLGLERLTWIASALSIGIGFGLQAIVQNFVSGLILLAERPVKVGDWVSLSGVEGDIRRINVRATEILLGDRSTVIVPNSELITKIVRNVTHGGPLGRVQILLPMPLNCPPEIVRETMLQALEANPDILDAPAPQVFMDDITVTNLTFKATAYVSSPRASYRVRSMVIFDILKRLREANVPLS
jgi:potassium efflux system protein